MSSREPSYRIVVTLEIPVAPGGIRAEDTRSRNAFVDVENSTSPERAAELSRSLHEYDFNLMDFVVSASVKSEGRGGKSLPIAKADIRDLQS